MTTPRTVRVSMLPMALASALAGCGLIFPSRPCRVEAYTPVFQQATAGDVATVRAALDRDPGLVRAHECDRRTLLHDAVGQDADGVAEMAAFLLDRGARVDARTKNEGMTPLHLAAETGNASIVDLLLRHGAAINATDHRGNTPLDLAISWDSPDVSTLLRARGGRENVTHPAGAGDRTGRGAGPA